MVVIQKWQMKPRHLFKGRKVEIFQIEVTHEIIENEIMNTSTRNTGNVPLIRHYNMYVP